MWMFQKERGSGLGSTEAFVHILPVNNLPDVLQVLGSQVVVLLVVGMLPDVHTQHWHKALQEKGMKVASQHF